MISSGIEGPGAGGDERYLYSNLDMMFVQKQKEKENEHEN